MLMGRAKECEELPLFQGYYGDARPGEGFPSPRLPPGEGVAVAFSPAQDAIRDETDRQRGDARSRDARPAPRLPGVPWQD